MSRAGFDEFNEGELDYNGNGFDEEFEFQDKPQCLCMERRTGMILGAAMPGLVMLCQSSLKWILTVSTSQGIHVLSQGFFEHFEVGLSACSLVTAVGMAAVFIGEDSKWKKTAVVAWLWLTVLLAVVILATGFSTSATLSMDAFKSEAVNLKEEKEEDFIQNNGKAQTEVIKDLKSVSVSIADDVRQKAWNSAVIAILGYYAQTGKIMDLMLVFLCLREEFTAYILGTLPALMFLTVAAYIYGYAVTLNCRLFPSNKQDQDDLKNAQANASEAIAATASQMSYTPY